MSQRSLLSPVAHPSTVWQECIDEALLDGPRLIQQWLHALTGRLLAQQQRALTPKDTQQWRQAHDTLCMVRGTIQGLWVSRWHQTMDEAPPTAHSSGLSASALRFEALEWMNQAQIDATVEAARFEQSVLRDTQTVVQTWFDRCNRLLPTHQRMALAHHPLRPESSIQALLHTLDTVCPDPQMRISWLQMGAEAWAEQLRRLYRLLDQVLDHQTMLPMPADSTPTPSTHQVSSSSVPSHITLSELHQLLVDDWNQPTTAPSTAWQTTTLAYEAPQPIQPDRRKKPRDGVSTMTSNGPERLTDLAEEVVGLMLDSIGKDARLLPPVVQVLQQLRPALLQAAREEPRFFSDRTNPARQLLDKLTQHSLAYSATQTHSTAFQGYLQAVQHTLNTLNADPHRRASARFSQALADFNAYLHPPASTASPQHNDAEVVAVLLKAEQRYLLLENIRQQMGLLPEMASAPSELQAFVRGPWAQVLADARLSPIASPSSNASSGELPAVERYWKLLPDLLWSCQPALIGTQKARLIKLIPMLLKQLREGLQGIQYPPEESRRLLAYIMAQHQQALKCVPASPSKHTTDTADLTALAEATLQTSPLVATGSKATAAAPDWESTVLFGASDFAQTEPLACAIDEQATPNDFSLWPELRVGAWVELDYPLGCIRRAKLHWISPQGRMYLFKDAAGEHISIAKAMYDNLLRQQRLRIVALHSMVDDALDTVMAQAVRNSVNTSESRPCD